jgi:hypothetical protein
MKCSCGKELNSGDINGLCRECENNQKIKAFLVYGWVCPVCGRCNSPYTTTCPCQPIKLDITCYYTTICPCQPIKLDII